MKSELKYKKYPYKARYPDPGNPNHSFYAFFREHGKKKRRSLGTRNERIAEKKFSELSEFLDKGVLGFSLRPKPLNFIEFARTYLRDGTHDLAEASTLRHRLNLFKQQRDKTNDMKTYLEKKGHLVEFFGSRDFKGIGVRDVLAYIRKRQNSGAAANTILKELATLSAMFQFAVSQELVLSNPVLSVKKPKLTLRRPHYTPTRKELLRIFQHLYPGARRFFLAFCNSGCRKAELVNANVGDVDLDSKVIRVRGKGHRDRTIPMNDILMKCIKEELAGRDNPAPSEPLFLNRDGTRYRSLRTPLETACKLAGVRHTSHHGLRHAYATLQYSQGVDLVSLSKLLGHVNPTVTQNIYVHVVDARLRRAAESFQIKMPVKKEQKRSK